MYFVGSQVIISERYCTCISLSQIDFVLANSADPDEMLHYAAFHPGLHCLPNCPLRVLWSTAVLYGKKEFCQGNSGVVWSTCFK